VGFVGALTRQKGVTILLEAMSRIRESTRCLIVGDGPERRRLESHARSLGIDSRVEFAGTVPHHRIPDILRSLQVFVLPAVSLPGLEERFGRVLVEAMASGVPVVASDSGQIPSVVGEGGRIYPEGDPDALAEALEDILGNRAGAREMGSRARRRAVEHFSWEVVGRMTRAVYESVRETLKSA
jgi:glycosyltransferase involved in cell wall biosynthesis